MKTKREADQFKLPIPRARTDTVFKRKGSRFYQARVRNGEKTVRRSTGALTKGGAEQAIPSLRKQLQRETSAPPQSIIPSTQYELI